MKFEELDEFTRAYCQTALWGSNDESDENGGEPMDANYGTDDIAPETLSAMAADCARFQLENAADLAPENCLSFGPDFGPDGRAGHDFWLTRNRHGAGFWDGDWADEPGERLSDAARKFGEVNLYIGDDGKIYCD